MGKDRTGVVIALLLRSLGVPVADVAEDYALSAIGAKRLLDHLQGELGCDWQDLDPYLPALLAADPDAMRVFLRGIYDKFGSVGGYLRHLEIGSSVEYLRRALLV